MLSEAGDWVEVWSAGVVTPSVFAKLLITVKSLHRSQEGKVLSFVAVGKSRVVLGVWLLTLLLNKNQTSSNWVELLIRP